MERVKITVDLLEDFGACPNQVAKFKRMWPKGAYVTKENSIRAARACLDLGWLFSRLSYHMSARSVRRWNDYVTEATDLCRDEDANAMMTTRSKKVLLRKEVANRKKLQINLGIAFWKVVTEHK